MSGQINDGGMAFPFTQEQWDNDIGRWRVCSDGGMTLRDYFASHAPEVPGGFMREVLTDKSGNQYFEDDFSWRARWAFAYADAMLKARQA